MPAGSEEHERFAENLRGARERAGLSQEDVAQRMAEAGHPMRQQIIARIETGQRPPRLDEAIALARAVGSDAIALTRPRGLTQEAWIISDETRQARVAHAEAITAARKFASIRARLIRRIARAERDGHAEALEAELSRARSVVALPPPLEQENP